MTSTGSVSKGRSSTCCGRHLLHQMEEGRRASAEREELIMEDETYDLVVGVSLWMERQDDVHAKDLSESEQPRLNFAISLYYSPSSSSSPSPSPCSLSKSIPTSFISIALVIRLTRAAAMRFCMTAGNSGSFVFEMKY